MHSSSGSGIVARQTSGRLPLILFGDSDAAAGYVHADNAHASVRYAQAGQEWAYHQYCHQGEGNAAAWCIKDEIGPLGPFPGTGIMRTTYMLDLGLALTAAGIPATILAYGVGSSTFDTYSPTLNPTAYATRNTWVRAMLGQMPGHLDPILITDQGMAGQGTYNWSDAMTTLMAALRTDLGYSDMKVCLIRCPWTAGSSDGENAGRIALQNYYRDTVDPSRCLIAVNDAMTYIDDTTLAQGLAHGVHFDSVAARKLAMGPDDATTTSIITVIKQLM